MDACPIIVLVFNLWLRHMSPPSNGGRWPQLEAEEALFQGLRGPGGWVRGWRPSAQGCVLGRPWLCLMVGSVD